MSYYSRWQDALLEFIKLYGQSYKVPYNLIEEFEQVLRKNINGKYFLGELK